MVKISGLLKSLSTSGIQTTGSGEISKLGEELRRLLDAVAVRDKELATQSQLLDAFFENTMTAIAIMDRDFNFIRVNEAYAAADNRKTSDFPGHNHFEFYPSDAADIFREVVATRRPYQTFSRPFVYPGHPERGVTYWDWTLAPVPDEAGEVKFLIFSLNNVTDRQRAQEALQVSEEFLNSIVENIPAMIFVKDAEELRFVRFNRAGETLLGYSRSELIGKNDHDFFPESEADFFTKKDREVLSRKLLVDIPEETIQTRHLGSRILHTKKIPLLDKEGVPRYLLGISEDITGRRQAEESLRRLNEELEQRVQERTAELEAKNRELDRMNRLFVGRELRMLELKKRIRELEQMLPGNKRGGQGL